MTDRPFHHGNLRFELLVEAVKAIREQGPETVSLRELARRTGVSHSAPRRHFPDRQALLDAVAEDGFRRLTTLVAEASAGGFRAVARAYVDFAIEDAALMDLMFAAKNAEPPPGLQSAAEEFFASVSGFFGPASPDGYPGRRQLLLIATLQGIATLVSSGRLPASMVDDLLDDTTALFTS